jgi:hypothetical protein
MLAGGTPVAARIDWISRNASADVRSFGVPTGTSMMTPPVASSRHDWANAKTSARCAGVSEPRNAPTKTLMPCSFSVIEIGCRSR